MALVRASAMDIARSSAALHPRAAEKFCDLPLPTVSALCLAVRSHEISQSPWFVKMELVPAASSLMESKISSPRR
jgi:hypothetical protein